MNQTRQNLNQIENANKEQEQQSSYNLFEDCIQQCDCASFPKQLKQCFKAWLLFLIAVGVYVSIWALNKYTINRQAAYYYLNTYSVSPYTSLPYFSNYTASSIFSSSKDMFTNNQVNDVSSVALSLLYSWIMWKFPLIVFSFKIVDNKVNHWIKYTTFGSFIIILLLVDILITAFQLVNYPDWIYYIVYVFLTFILIFLNSIKQTNLCQMLNNAFWPLSYIAVFYASYSILIPALYNVFYKNLIHDTAVFVQVYIFPLVDLLSYSILIGITILCTHRAKKFIEIIYFLNSGYALGNILLTGYTQVEFYYLIGYFILRNIASNWILQNLQKQVKNPIVLPGWGILYYLSYGLNYIPLIGIGKLVISKSFFSQMLIFAFPILNYQIQSEYYISTSPYPSSTSDTINYTFSGNMHWGAALIIWFCLIFSQKYHYHEVQIKSFFFYLIGIYLFYIGLSCGLQLDYLRLNSL